MIVNNNTNDLDLKQLALEWLKKSEFEVKTNSILEGRSGEDYKIDLLVSNRENQLGRLAIKIADIKKSAGTDVISKIERTQKDLSTKTLLISNKFSVQAKHLANRANVMLMDRNELENCFLT